MLLEEGSGSTEVEPEDYAAARPDPLCCDELLGEHGSALAVLGRKVRRWAGADDAVHVLALDRFGVVSRVECAASCYDLRLPFEAPVSGRGDVAGALAVLLRCTAG